MVIEETSISTAQRSFGIAGLTRSELHEIRSFIETLRRPSSDSENISEKQGQNKCHTYGGGDSPQPVCVVVRPVVKHSAGKSRKRPRVAYTRKQRAVLRRRAERGAFLVIGNLFVLAPKIRASQSGGCYKSLGE